MSSVKNHSYTPVPGVSSAVRTIHVLNRHAAVSNVRYHLADADPFFFSLIGHHRVISMLATALGIELCLWYSGSPIRNWSPTCEAIRTIFAFDSYPSANARSHKTNVRHTVHTIVSWLHLKQWHMINIFICAMLSYKMIYAYIESYIKSTIIMISHCIANVIAVSLPVIES